MLCPLLKLVKSKYRRRQKTALLTSSLYKVKLEIKNVKNDKKEALKAQKQLEHQILKIDVIQLEKK